MHDPAVCGHCNGTIPHPDRAPGRYCLATCYCGDCEHYRPIPEVKIQEHHLKPPKWVERYRKAYQQSSGEEGQ